MGRAHTILGADGRPVRRWRMVEGETFRLMTMDGRLVHESHGATIREELPLDDPEPIDPFPGPHTLTWEVELTDAARHAFGLGPYLSAAQQRGAVPLDPNHTGPDLETPTP